MKIINKFISDIIMESALDSRIPDGVINLKNTEHIQVIAERLYDNGIDEQAIDEFVQTFVDEGKYPERQAYNKDGWLVTFPSKEYRDAAIKKKTHYSSDPTHGKGGMNLYYKKKGKQKRQTQQAASTVSADKPDAQAASKGPVAKPVAKVSPQKSEEPSGSTGLTPSEKERLAKITAKSTDEPDETAPATEPTKQEPAPKSEPSAPIEPKSAEAPAIEVPVVTTPPEEYATISKKFAAQKGWMITPYNEYKDANGNPVAVVGLSGEAVPIKNNDREEYKIFAEKNKV